MKGPSIEAGAHIPAAGKGQDSRQDKLRKACKEFESIFTYQLLKSMRDTVQKCDLFHGGTGEEIYESLLDQELAKSMAGLGANSLSELLYRQLSREEDPAAGPAAPGTLHEPATPGWPLRATVSSEFGWRNDPIDGQRKFHYGLDLAAREGTPVRASMAGRVIRSEYTEGYGNVVVLDHGRGLTTLYAHNRENLVRQGDWVEAGEAVARVGSTGRSTGAHLHFEVRRHGRRQDPVAFLSPGQIRPEA